MMSFEIFLQRFDNGRQSGISAEFVRAAFSNFADDSTPDDWHFWYSANDDCHVAVSRPNDDSSLIDALTVDRPCGDTRLWHSLFQVLQLGQWVLYWPAEPPPLIMADAAYASQLPPDMLKALGPVQVVHSADEILRLLNAS